MSKVSQRIADLSPEKQKLLSHLLREKGVATPLTPPPLSARVRDSNVLASSFAQQRLWFLDQLEPGSSAYNISRALRLRGKLDVASLEKTLNEIVRRHEVLRTTFEMRDGQPMQVIAPSAKLLMPIESLEHLDETEREKEARRLVQIESRTSFDLARGPLLRAKVLRLAADDNIILLTMHHIVSDGWSAGVLIRELGSLYEAFAHDRPSPLSELPIQYADFALWQREWLQGEVLDAQLAYWKEQLGGNLPVMEMPTDRPRPAMQTYRGAHLGGALPQELTAPLLALSQQEGATLFMTLLAAFQTLLARYTRQYDIVVGTPVANRHRPEIERLVGFFINALPLRTDLSGNPTFRELLRKVREVALGAYAHQDLPFEKLVDELQPERDPSHPPVFQVAFSVQRPATEPGTSSNLPLTPLNVESGTSKVDLTMVVIEAGERLTTTIEYNTDLFDEATVRRMLRHFQRLLESIVAEPDRRINSLAMLSRDESRQLLVDWNDTRTDIGDVDAIHRLFEKQVARTPDATALVFEENQISYRELDERANQLAHYLQSLGVGPEVLVGFCIERSIEMVVGLLAILKAGGAYVPLDPAYPMERLAVMLEDAQLAILLTQESLLDKLPAHWAQIVCVDEDANAFLQLSKTPPANAIDGENLAYVIYTSGSTGHPKGVMARHRSVVNHVKAVIERYVIKETDRLLQFVSPSFDVFGEEIFPTLCCGATLLLHRHPTQLSPEELVEVWQQLGATGMHIPPAYWHQLVDQLAERGQAAPECMKALVVGAESPSVERLSTWAALCRHETRFINAYGPAEATVTATTYEAPMKEWATVSMRRVPMGTPVANTQVYVLDSEMQAVPIGVAGEIFIGGFGLSRGYLNQPELTAERFIPNPFSEMPGERLYRTGDLARHLPDGNIEFLGRADQQVKVRGFRVELGEIETALREHHAVNEAVALVREDVPGDKRLVAYVVPDGDHAIRLNGQQLYRLPNDLEVAHLNKSETDLLYHELYEEKTYFDGDIRIGDGDCIFDVGANIGLFTLYLNQAFRDTRIFAFEPLPAIFDKLRTNVNLYGLNAKLFECGLSNEAGTATFTYYPQMTAMSGRYANAEQDEEVVRAFISNQDAELSQHADEFLEGKFSYENHTCELKTLSDVIREQGVEAIDLLKIDTEKSELDVLNGIAPDDWKKIKQLALEVHGDDRLAEARPLLESHGFKLTIKQDHEAEHTGLYKVYARRPSNGAEVKDSAPDLTASRPMARLQKRTLEAGQLRGHLKEKLPDYMIPAAIVVLPELPLTPNGKVDRKSLPAPAESRDALAQEFVPPGTEAEKLLAAIWSDVLRVEKVGVSDNFFELGGDSILSIQIVSKANQAGLPLTTRQLFQHQTIAELASSIGESESVQSDQGIVTGPVPLSPAQHWFFEQQPANPHHFNQSVLLEAKEPLDTNVLKQVVGRLMEHHDALRLRFVRDGSAWRQFNAGTDEAIPFSVVDLSEVNEQDRRTAIERSAAELQASLNIENGPTVRVAYFDLGPGNPARLLFIVHHLAMDGVSWRILLEDLHSAYVQLSRDGEATPPSLPPKSTSFKAWSIALNDLAQSEEVKAELAYWTNPSRSQVDALPIDSDGQNSIESAQSFACGLTEQQTRALLTSTNTAYRTQINEVLLTALAMAVNKWYGSSRILVELEGHGREDIVPAVDVSRTVGWFTSMMPMLLEFESGAGTGAILRSVKDQSRGVPGRGIGYGLLRYLSNDESIRQSMLSMPRPQMSFNYLGQFDQALPSDSPFRGASESKGPPTSGSGSRMYLLGVSARVAGDRMRFAFSYSENVHRRETIEEIARLYTDALTEIIDHCATVDRAALAPSDIPLAKLDQTQIEMLLGDKRAVEDVYPLSPMQQGILFHSLLDPDAGAYIAQISCRFDGLDIDAFERAWGNAMDRHAILRTSFLWDDLSEPLQVVHEDVRVPLDRHDWRQTDISDHQTRIEEFLKADRQRKFDLSTAPMMRLSLVRLSDEQSLFTWTFHHIMIDGWSGPIIMRDVYSSYEAYLSGREPTLDPIRPYRDYIEWLSKRDISTAEEFWRKELAGFTSPTPLPLDRRVTRGVTPGFGIERRQLNVEATAKLQDLSRRRQLTMNTVVQGAWALLLSRYSGELDVVFGATVSGRPAELEGADRMVGLFINTLPVRVMINQGVEALEWLRDLQTRQVDARQFEHSELIQIQGWSDAPRGVPLFETLMVFEKFPIDSSVQKTDAGKGRQGLAIKEIRAEEHTHYPLTLEAVPGDELRLRLAYDKRYFEAASVARMADHLQSLLIQIAENPSRRLEDLQLMTPAERRQVLYDWNESDEEFPDDTTFARLFEAQVELSPGAIAVSSMTDKLSYRDLNERANRVANALINTGIGPEVTIALLAERSVDFLVTILAVFKAGAAYLPLDPLDPIQRIAQIIERSGTRFILTTNEFADGIIQAFNETSVSDRPLVLTLEDLLSADPKTTSPVRQGAATDLAYVIYTSGSTGIPKGAMIEQRGMINHIFAKIRALDLGPADVVAQTASQCFDISVWQFLAVLLAGGQVRIFDNEIAHDPTRLLAEADAAGVTILEMVPSMLRAMLDDRASKNDESPSSSSLRWLVPTGEALTPDVCRQWFSAFPDIPMMNAYGPTECSDDVTHYVITEPPAQHTRLMPIGRPIQNTKIYILDRDLRPVPIGIYGELCVGGVGVGRGYLNDPNRTSDAFVSDPFSDKPGARLYRTGDLARFLSDGTVEFLGRRDAQVKVRGHRIELGEIEAAIRDHDSISEVVVIAREDRPGDMRLVAYVVMSADTPDSVERLQGFLKVRLPEYMIPSQVVRLESLPLTANGKIDRRALPEPEHSRLESDAYTPPQDAVEEVLVGIWEEVLHLERVGIHDNFFELGGHSLLATQLISRIRRALQTEVRLRTVFESPTIAQIAEKILADSSNSERIRARAGLLMELSRLSDDEVENMLQNKVS